MPTAGHVACVDDYYPRVAACADVLDVSYIGLFVSFVVFYL